MSVYMYFLAVLKYLIQVTTGAEPMGATDASVYLNVLGEKGDTGKRLLHRSNNDDLFQTGQV